MRDHPNCANCGKRLQDNNLLSYCDAYCQEAFESGNRSCAKQIVNDDEVWNGTYEHIAWEPIKITGGRRELIEVCKKHNCMAKGLLKSKSRGKGYEMQRSPY